MKKITLLFLLCVSSLIAQIPQNYLEVTITDSVNASQGTALVTSLASSAQSIIATYTDLTSFQNDITANCSDATLVLEDFSNGPSDVMDCGTSVSSAGDGCFAAGELEAGFIITASDGMANTNVVSISSLTIGNADPLVGAISFADFTIVTFTPAVYAVAFDVWENDDPTTAIRIYGNSGNLINSYNVNTPTNTQTFFGFISDEEVGRVELEGNNNSGELIGKLYFGANCSALSTQDILDFKVSFYPNPAADNIIFNLTSGINLSTVTAIDVLGKRTKLDISEGNVVDVTPLANGTYILNIETPNGTLTKKLIKK
jgi:hypothetical protein